MGCLQIVAVLCDRQVDGKIDRALALVGELL
jgi:hypothetical protein